MNKSKVSKILFSLFFVLQASGSREYNAMRQSFDSSQGQEISVDDEPYIIFEKNVKGKCKRIRLNLLGDANVKNQDKKPIFIIDDSGSKVDPDNLGKDFENMNRAAFFLFKHYGCLNFYRYRHYMSENSADFLIGLDKNRRYICSLDNIERDPSVSRHVSKIVKENLEIVKSDNCKKCGTQNFAYRIKNIDSNQGSTVFLFYLCNDQYKEYCNEDKNEEDYRIFKLDNPYKKITKTVKTLVPDYDSFNDLVKIGKVSDYGYHSVDTGKNNRSLRKYSYFGLNDRSSSKKEDTGVSIIRFGNDLSVSNSEQQNRKTNYTDLKPIKTTKLNILKNKS